MTCSVVGASGRHATLGTPSGFHCRGGLQPLPASGNRFVGRRQPLKSRSIVRAIPDGETSRAAIEALGNLGGPHPILDLIDHASLMLYSLSDGVAVAPAADVVQSTVAAGADVAATTVSAVADAAATTASAAADTAASLASTAVDTATSAATAAADTAASVAPDAAEAATSDAGWFGFLANAFEAILQIIDGGLEALHVPYAYGFSIILLTLGVKALTFPLSKKQVESSISMQQLQPRVKEIQEKFANNPERLQQETAKLYQDAGVNPLAGCLPTLATIPIFIGLYRSLTQAADEGLLKEGWFFIPSLAGPTTMGADGGGISWLFPFVDGAPPVGWHDAGAYLILPVLLVVSQVVSQKIISPPKSDDPSQQQMQTFLQILPFMLGWFSLNVPSGLTLYWITNNILSTGQQAYLKSTTKAPELKPMGTVVKPKEEPIQRVTGAERGSRRSRAVDVEAVDVSTPAPPPAAAKGAKFRARKAKEAAKKAAAAAMTAPPELAAEITPLTENIEKEFVEGEEEGKNGNGSPTQAWAVKEPATAAPMVAGAAGGSRGKKKKGKKGKKGRK
ncbi:hypothetical protein BSKO_11195 [Bryopsis sp. KO-2023]|nr:hypothetical protein BSKO_11195 [Bryopsis sp. KO-2023]